IVSDGLPLLRTRMAANVMARSKGATVLLAEVQDCIGQFIAPNVILYDDAFTDIKGAVRYTYTKAGFEQDVLIYDSSALGSPEDYGLTPATTLLEMYSEFHSAPTPLKITEITPDNLTDEVLNLPQMAFRRCKAFGIDAP